MDAVDLLVSIYSWTPVNAFLSILIVSICVSALLNFFLTM